MNAPDILFQLHRIGLTLTVHNDAIRAMPKAVLTDEARTLIRAHKAELLEVLSSHPPVPTLPQGDALGAQLRHPVFDWSPLDPETTREALAERIGILMFDAGMSETEAVQEAAWQQERARCWERFQSHARIILEAGYNCRGLMLEEYRSTATTAFGDEVAANMLKTMIGVLAARERREYRALSRGRARRSQHKPAP